jgi:hypothetical protein
MYCPNCGNQAAAEQKFCRSCGLELQAIAQAVTQQLTGKTGTPSTRSEAAQLARMSRWLFGGICVLVSGMALLAVNKMLISEAAVGLGGVFTLLLGVLIATYGVISPMLHPPKAISQTPQPAELPAAETTSKLALASGAEPVSSVIEETTRTLEPAAVKANDQS